MFPDRSPKDRYGTWNVLSLLRRLYAGLSYVHSILDIGGDNLGLQIVGSRDIRHRLPAASMGLKVGDESLEHGP